MARRRKIEEDYEEFDEYEVDPVAMALERLMETPQVNDIIGKATRFLDMASGAIDRIGRPPTPDELKAKAKFIAEQRAAWIEARKKAAEEQAKWQRQQKQQSQPPKEDPLTVLGFPAGSKPTKAEIKARQRALAGLWHPDKGGSVEAMSRLNAAVDALLK